MRASNLERYHLISDSILYPRIKRVNAEHLWAEIQHLSISDLSPRVALDHDKMFFTATGGRRAQRHDMETLRRTLDEAAQSCGFPADSGRELRARFDTECARAIYGTMSILPGEAASSEVWSFIGLVLCPDLARWRFPTAGIERFIGGPSQRNTFQRLWWRAHVLRRPETTDPYDLLEGLPEDALVQIMERPGICSNVMVGRLIGEAFVELIGLAQQKYHERILRDAAKMIRQRIPVVSFDVLTPSQVKEQITAMVMAAAQNYS